MLNHDNKFLILKRSGNKDHHANIWNLPSGRVEDGESLIEAGIREAKEETSLDIFDVEAGKSLDVYVDDQLTLEVNYLISRTNVAQVKLNSENTEYMWVTPIESLGYEFAISKEKVKDVLKSFGLL